MQCFNLKNEVSGNKALKIMLIKDSTGANKTPTCFVFVKER